MEKCLEKILLIKLTKTKTNKNKKQTKHRQKRRQKNNVTKTKQPPFTLVLPTVGTVPELVGCIEVVVEVVDDAADGLRSTVVTVGNGTA